MPRVRAITFDLWDTVLIDDSDESKRKAAGKSSKRVERRDLLEHFLRKHTPVPRNIIDAAYDVADEAFRKVWGELHVTWTVRERLSLILKGLGASLPDREMDELVRLHEDMELEFRPDFASGVHDALRTLHGRYTLGVISDTVFSPGRTLRKLLADEGLLELFEVLIFSDEAGCSKPEEVLFTGACRSLGIKAEELLHVGDREEKDIVGPHAVGARGILCTVVVDRGSSGTKAEAVFDDYRKLPEIVEQLDER